MAESEVTGLDELVARLSAAPTMDELPSIIDISTASPANPPERIQTQFVGLSYERAFTEAATFVKVADEWAAKYGIVGGLGGAKRIVDFGSGWGRITRMLLTKTGATKIHALDVDPEMTALVNTTLPGVNAMTVDAMPPTPLASGSITALTAFSVFSHLAPVAHEAWAAEFARLVAPGGLVFITALDRVFLEQIEAATAAVAAGTADEFSTDMAGLFDDIATATTDFDEGRPAYAGNGGGGIRTGDYYGWAAMPNAYVVRVWGEAGFDVCEWVPSNILFPQAMVALRRRPDVRPAERALASGTARLAAGVRRLRR